MTRRMLLDEGVTAAAIRHRVVKGRLRALHPGVYTTAHGDLRREQLHLAATLACGSATWSAHGSAAELWRVLAAAPGPPHVVRTGPHRDGPPGVVVHRTTHLPAAEVTVHRGVPVTTPARTLLDLAALDHAGLELALDETRARRLVGERELLVLARSGRRGGARLRRLLVEAPGFTRQEAERRLRSLVLRAQFPTAHFNETLLGRERDVVFPLHRVVLEVDGYATHAGRRAFEADRRRDQELAVAGYLTLRVTWRQLTHQPEALVARIAGALAARGGIVRAA